MPAACGGLSVYLSEALFLGCIPVASLDFFCISLAVVLVAWFIGMITSATGMQVPAGSHYGQADISVPSPGVCRAPG
jgi:hypothetical protein